MKLGQFDIIVKDNVLPPTLQQEVWNYLEHQKWHVYWWPINVAGAIGRFIPAEGFGVGYNAQRPIVQHTAFHRCCIASDENSLIDKHPFIHNIWMQINNQLGDAYELTGYPEDMFDDEYKPPHTDIQGYPEGWRVYVNGLLPQTCVGTWGPHRDTPDMSDDTSVTILYVINKEWYPSWGGELVFFPEDPNGTTGDRQQFNKAQHQQKRGYNIGWPEDGLMLSPKSNRVIVYDGRCLHTTKPLSLSHNTPHWKIAFRARKKI